jgi:enoyl-CoA hydratase/carnithine racemase
MNKQNADGRISVSVVDGVASVEIDNTSQRNALTKSMCIELTEVMQRIDAREDVTVITIRGSGAIFSAGASINELPAILLDPQEDGTSVDHLSRADEAIASSAKPTIALIDGACMGGGWQIASACDFIIASERSRFGITPAKLGVVYPRAGIERLIRQVGDATAKYVLFTGDTLSASRAQLLGLVAEVVPDDEFDSRCAEIVATIQGNSQFSVHTLKQLVSLTTSESDSLDQSWIDAWMAMVAGPDMSIGVDAFERREQPRFTWTPASGIPPRPHP